MISGLLRNHRAAIILIALFFFIGFRGYYGLHVFSEYDDACYYRTAAMIAGIESKLPFHAHACAPGTALAWAPLLAIAEVVAIYFNSATDAWAQPLIGFSSFLFFAFGSILLGKSLNRLFPQVFNNSIWGVIFGVTTPILFFVLHRTTMAHAFEYFIVAQTLWLVLIRHFKYAILAAFVAASVRYNDFPLLFVVLGAWADNKGRRLRLSSFIFGMTIITLFAVALVLSRGYSGITFSVLASLFSVGAIPKILWGGNFGLIWTAPIWLGTLIWGSLRFAKLSNASRAVIFWMWALLVLQSMWGGFGSSFGYRYFLGSWLCVVIVIAELWGSKATSRQEIWARRVLGINAVWIVILFWLFQTTAETSLWETSTGNYDNVRLLGNTVKALWNPSLLVRPIALSPMASLTYSWFLPELELTRKYVLAGPQLIVLSVACLVVGGILIVALLSKGWPRSRNILNKERQT